MKHCRLNFRSTALGALLAAAAGAASALPAIPVTFNANFASVFQTHVGAGTSYVDQFSFTLDQGAPANFGVFSFSSSIANDYDISDVTLLGPNGTYTFTNHSLSTQMEIFSFTPLGDLLAGDYILQVIGAVAPNASVGSYSGNLTISAVPEPQTYLLMAAGIAAIGVRLTRRRDQRAVL